MNEREIREMLVEALEQASVYEFRHLGVTEAFIAGATDVPIVKLSIDSMAEMELCIAIEVNTGVTLLPEDLRSCPGLGDLVQAIARGLNA